MRGSWPISELRCAILEREKCRENFANMFGNSSQNEVVVGVCPLGAMSFAMFALSLNLSRTTALTEKKDALRKNFIVILFFI